jgi:type II secretory pathway component PulM
MSPRERNLLLLFAAAGFLVLNLLGFGFMKSKRAELDRKLADAEQKLVTAESFQANAEEVADEMQWLTEHEPAPVASQDTLTELQQFCESEANNADLTIKSQKPLDTDETEGRHYHRARMQLNVTGREQALYQWLDQINDPAKLRSATQLHLTPDAKDDTLIDCTATIDQWFVPATQ